MPISDERTALVEKMAAIIVEDCPWIFLYQPMQFGLVQQWVKNYMPHAFPYGMGKYRNIDVGERLKWVGENDSGGLDVGGAF